LLMAPSAQSINSREAFTLANIRVCQAQSLVA